MSVTPTAPEGDRSAYEPLLRQLAVLYGHHEARRKEPFNLFSVLRKASDEEHLHSKFLAALLNWKSPEDGATEGPGENLRDFVQQVVTPAVEAEREAPDTTEQPPDHGQPDGPQNGAPSLRASAESYDRREADVGETDAHQGLRSEEFSFSLAGARVEREKHHIDLLIRNAAGQAIVIENKIWAGDQWQQLQGYFQKVADWGLEPTLVYLTPYGHEPSDHSRGSHEVVSLSYKWHLIPWLRRCQERACDEPPLRESVAQYIALIRTLCGDSGREFMTEVKKVLREGNNLILARRLGDAVAEVWRDRLFDYWEGVRLEVEKHEPALGVPLESQKRLKRWLEVFVYGLKRKGFRQAEFHYSWRLNAAARLAIEGNRWEGIFYGVICGRDAPGGEYDRLQSKMSSSGFGDATPYWPGRKFVYRGKGGVKGPSEGAIERLDDTQQRSEVALDLIKTWESLREP